MGNPLNVIFSQIDRLTEAWSFERELRMWLGEYRTILDVGCGSDSPLNRIESRGKTIGLEKHEPTARTAWASSCHDAIVIGDAEKVGKLFCKDAVECAVALDVIEHLDREQGLTMLNGLEYVASERVVVFTPNGFMRQPASSGNPYQEHKSGWSAGDFYVRNYKVIGINGAKWLRGRKTIPRFRPHSLFGLISDFTQPLVREHPKYAHQLLAVKDL